jgi:hypothetical protein
MWDLSNVEMHRLDFIVQRVFFISVRHQDGKLTVLRGTAVARKEHPVPQ